MNDMSEVYARFAREELILRDELALDRTILANERTILAYIRTALALLLAGVTFIHFAQATWFTIVGAVCVAIGILTLAIGARRFQQMRKLLRSLRLATREIKKQAEIGIDDQAG